MSFTKFVNMTENTPFSPILHIFCTPKRCMHIHCLVLKNNPNYVIFFYKDDIQLQIQVPPPLMKTWVMLCFFCFFFCFQGKTSCTILLFGTHNSSKIKIAFTEGPLWLCSKMCITLCFRYHAIKKNITWSTASSWNFHLLVSESIHFNEKTTSYIFVLKLQAVLHSVLSYIGFDIA